MADLVLWALVIAVLVVLPSRAVLRAWRRTNELADGDPEVRKRKTLRTIATQWGLAIGLVVAWLASGRDLVALRLVTLPASMVQWGTFAVTVGVVGFVTVSSLRTARSPEALERVRAQVQPELLGLMPRTPADWRRYVLLSITAGVCEEFLYRGVALVLLTEGRGLIVALVLTSISFGVAHAYQGVRGVATTAIVAVVFGGGVIASGSLVLAMIVHALVDIVQGHMLAAAVRAGPADVPSPPSL